MLLRPPWRRLRNGLRQSGAEHDAPRSRLYWRQWQSSTARGGLVIQFTVAPHASWDTYDQDGQQINSDNLTNQWHYRRVDLTPFAGKTINWMWITADSQTLPGYYDMTFQDIALVSADGAVRRVFSRDKTIALTPFASSGVTGQAYSISHAAGVGWYPPVTTTYYHGDHLGSSRQMTNADGYPVWEATYLPYGQERAVAGGSSASVNHYKFTGKERDGESGLDYFGARYYASAQGRFLSPDNFVHDTHTSDPPSWNLYSYVRNNPLNLVDPNGQEVYSGNLSDDEKKRIIKQLKKVTGFKKISFDKDNKLVIDQAAGFKKKGSAGARDLLTKAVASEAVRFSLTSTNNSGDVAFARNDAGTVNADSGITTYRTEIDFADFKGLGGDKAAKNAFTIGLNLLHEFGHGIYETSGGLPLPDEPNSRGFPGPLELGLINPIRSELGLAQRLQYRGQLQPDGDRVNLLFRMNERDKILTWSNSRVGGRVIQ